MAEIDRAFTGSIPVLYDRYMVPLLFEPYAQDLAQRLAGMKEGRLLEIAAGTGAVTRALDRTLPPGIKIVASDFNQAMLDHAMTVTNPSRISWRQADAQALPFEDGEFDAVVCQFGVMFFPDKQKAFREARRVLKPGGRYLFNVWGSLEANPVSLVVADAVAACFPQDPPQFFRRTPYGHFDQAPIRRELEAAGFPKVDAQTVAKHTQASARDAAFGLCQGSPLRNEIEARDPKGLDKATEAAARAIATRFGDGPIDNRMQAIVFEAVRPR
jgi:ubiquinone/menaquinone biosynthesis C-methylase UbiE